MTLHRACFDIHLLTVLEFQKRYPRHGGRLTGNALVWFDAIMKADVALKCFSVTLVNRQPAVDGAAQALLEADTKAGITIERKDHALIGIFVLALMSANRFRKIGKAPSRVTLFLTGETFELLPAARNPLTPVNVDVEPAPIYSAPTDYVRKDACIFWGRLPMELQAAAQSSARVRLLQSKCYLLSVTLDVNRMRLELTVKVYTFQARCRRNRAAAH
jgi:hypothetical protein